MILIESREYVATVDINLSFDVQISFNKLNEAFLLLVEHLLKPLQ